MLNKLMHELSPGTSEYASGVFRSRLVLHVVQGYLLQESKCGFRQAKAQSTWYLKLS